MIYNKKKIKRKHEINFPFLLLLFNVTNSPSPIYMNAIWKKGKNYINIVCGQFLDIEVPWKEHSFTNDFYIPGYQLLLTQAS